MDAIFPVGYGSARVTLGELTRQHTGRMEPEFARRLFAWIASLDGKIGIGSSWRPNPHNVSRASREGKSFHQTQTFTDGMKAFCAVDLVVPTKTTHSSGAVPANLVPLQGSAEAAKWGVHVNVGKVGKPGFESWHMQPIEIDGWTRWSRAGRPRPAPNYVLPHDPGTAPTPPPSVGEEVDPFAPEWSEYALYAVAEDKPEVHQGSEPRPDDLVRYLQAVMRNQCRLTDIEIDGYFGDVTEAGVRSVQRWNGLGEDGRCGTKTWACIDAYAAI